MRRPESMDVTSLSGVDLLQTLQPVPKMESTYNSYLDGVSNIRDTNSIFKDTHSLHLEKMHQFQKHKRVRFAKNMHSEKSDHSINLENLIRLDNINKMINNC